MIARIAVITPYCHEPRDILWQCHASVAGQDVAADHFMIADGFPLDAIDGWPVRHVRLPTAHDDNGNTPRGVGGLLARAAGYDFIAYLDADNWYHPGHLSSLVTLADRTGSALCSAFRTFHDLAGNPLATSEGDEDALRHVDTSTLLIHRAGFDLLGVWSDMPRPLSPICDRVFVAAVTHRQRTIKSTGQRTVAFRTRYAAHYRDAGRPVPPDAKDGEYAAAAVAYLLSRAGVSECIRTLGFWPGTYLAIG